MHETVHSLVADPGAAEDLNQFFRVTSAYIIGTADEEPRHPELRERWSRQKTLDLLVIKLTKGNDDEAIAIAKEHLHRPAVFVGILARMMESGREGLIEFALSSIQSNPELASFRYNGRFLLHFAASYACLPIVDQLLADGVDPNILDQGRHTPLYRVGATRRGESGAKVVEALVLAGAALDHCGGVNRATALHEAARQGTLEVVRALVRSGANPHAKDKNGVTPLRRALNRRRMDVADFLSAQPR